MTKPAPEAMTAEQEKDARHIATRFYGTWAGDTMRVLFRALDAAREEARAEQRRAEAAERERDEATRVSQQTALTVERWRTRAEQAETALVGLREAAVEYRLAERGDDEDREYETRVSLEAILAPDSSTTDLAARTRARLRAEALRWAAEHLCDIEGVDSWYDAEVRLRAMADEEEARAIK